MMPKLERLTVDVDVDLTITYIPNPGSEMANWSNTGVKLVAANVIDRIDRALGLLDDRRRRLESAKSAVIAVHRGRRGAGDGG